jgi:hypothetical protein
MTYTKQTWTDSPSATTPISAARLGYIENGVEAAHLALDLMPITIALSDEVTAVTTGVAKVTWRAPFAMTLTAVPRASLNTASSTGTPTVDINVGGTSILHATNKLTIDATEKTSATAAIATSLVTTAIADDAEFTFDIDVAGTGATGLKITLYYKRP